MLTVLVTAHRVQSPRPPPALLACLRPQSHRPRPPARKHCLFQKITTEKPTNVWQFGSLENA